MIGFRVTSNLEKTFEYEVQKFELWQTVGHSLTLKQLFETISLVD